MEALESGPVQLGHQFRTSIASIESPNQRLRIKIVPAFHAYSPIKQGWDMRIASNCHLVPLVKAAKYNCHLDWLRQPL